MPIASLCCKGESLEHGEKYLGQNGGERQQRATWEQESVLEASVSFCLELRPSHSPAVWVSVLLRFTKPGKFSSSSFSLCSSLFTESILPLHSASSFICWDTENRPLSQNSHVLTRARASGEHIFVVPQKGQWLYLLRATLLKKKKVRFKTLRLKYVTPSRIQKAMPWRHTLHMWFCMRSSPNFF